MHGSLTGQKHGYQETCCGITLVWPCNWWIWKALSIIWTGSVLQRPLNCTASFLFLKTCNEGGYVLECLSQLHTCTGISHSALVLHLKIVVICLLVWFNFEQVLQLHPQSKLLLLLISNLNLGKCVNSSAGHWFWRATYVPGENFWTDCFRTCDFYFF